MNNCPCCGQRLTNNVDESDVDAVMSYRISKLKTGEHILLGLNRRAYRNRLENGATVELLKLEIDQNGGL